ncbi:MAG: lamin tail domain-containing protein [Patescibacteria group bacterium]|jgi:hypothetical protein
MHQRGRKLVPGFLFLGIFLLTNLFYGGFEVNEAKAGLANHVVINEVSIDGVIGTGGSEDDWVELYNPTDESVDLSGWSIQKTAGSGSSASKVALSGVIPANNYFLIVRNGASTVASLRSIANILVSSSFSLSAGNIIYLVNDNEKISSTTNPYLDENIVDFVGFGVASFFEGNLAAPAIPEAQSIARIPAGEDTDENSVDFQIQNIPTPTNSSLSNDNSDIGGTVLLTVALESDPVRNISTAGAEIFFQVNSIGNALVYYGLDESYGNSTGLELVSANTVETIAIDGLTCDTSYFYAVRAENLDSTENDQTENSTFTTLPCGIVIDSLVMTKTSAKADDQYGDGWQWEFNITIWDMLETSLKMKFDQWTGAGSLAAGNNMQYSVDEGENWVSIEDDGVYPEVGADIENIDMSTTDGRQVKILVRMKVPFGTSAGYYDSSYGILTE